MPQNSTNTVVSVAEELKAFSPGWTSSLNPDLCSQSSSSHTAVCWYLRLNLGSPPPPPPHTHTDPFLGLHPNCSLNLRFSLCFLSFPTLSKSYGLCLHDTPAPDLFSLPSPLAPPSSRHSLSSPDCQPVLPHQSQSHLLKMGISSHQLPSPNPLMGPHHKKIP